VPLAGRAVRSPHGASFGPFCVWGPEEVTMRAYWILILVVSGTLGGWAAVGGCGGDDSSTCTPSCAGRACGLDPVCYTLSCGNCPTGQTCTAAGTCQPGTTNPTNEQLCLDTMRAYCQRGIACSLTCPDSTPVTDVEQCLQCVGARDSCAVVPDASATATSARVAACNTCWTDLGVAACADISSGAFPASCSAC